MRKIFILLALALFLTGCATTGKFSRLSLDMTKGEVIKVIGKPAVVRNVEKSPDGKHTREIWEYMEYKTGDDSFYGRSTQYWVVIEDGKLARWGEPFDVGAQAVPTGRYQLEWSDMAQMRRQDMQMYQDMDRKLNDFMTKNKQNIAKLSIGMTKENVLNILGSDSIDIGSQIISNPYKIETIKGKEVIYYYTDIKNRDGVISDDELTPLIFENNKLVGIGHNFLENIKEKNE